ncbi:MAG TPA: medium chain dehydrogenase/reductase family protein [Balneolaceae bacterium]|nr:medium chain dehydrogenase/reductase family protein [Balneolaceae bacterium]
MRQIVTTKSGGINVLQIKEMESPKPRNGEILIRVKAAGLNFADILARQGLYPDAPKMPCVMGYEVSGIVESTGDGVSDDWIGKEVVALTRFGGQSEMISVPAMQVFEKPSRLSFEEAAAIPVIYLTAYALIVVMGALKKEETILIHNAGGGVGLAALDIAKHIGSRTIGTASGRKHDFLKKRGLDHAIDYRTKDWSPVVDKLTGGKGVELVIDPLGGDHWRKSYKALRATGRLGMFGVSTAGGESGLSGKLRMLKTAISMPFFHPISLLDNNRSVFGMNLGHLWNEGEKVRGWMKELLKGVEEGWIQPYVDTTFPFEKIGEAHTYIEERQNIGKVILVP